MEATRHVTDVPPLSKSFQPSGACAAKPEGTGDRLDAGARRKHVNVPKCDPQTKEWKLPVDLSWHANSLPIMKHNVTAACELEPPPAAEKWRASDRMMESSVLPVGVTATEMETRTEAAA